MYILYTILWALSGAASFIYWQTKYDDFTVEDIFRTLLATVLGPFMFLLGFAILGDMDHGDKIVLIKRRKYND